MTSGLTASISNSRSLELIVITIVFMISPVICFPLLVIGVYNQKKYAYFYICMFMGLLSMYYYPQGDQYRYLTDLLTYKNQSFSEIIDFNIVISIRNFNLITLSLFAASKTGFITLEIYRMLIVCFGCGIMMYIYQSVASSLENKIPRLFQFKLFLILLLSIPVYYMTQGFRSGLGAIFLSLGMYKLLQKNQSGYFWMLVSAFIHFSYLPLSIIYILGLKLKFRINNKNFIFYFLLLMLLLVTGITALYGKIPFITMMLDIYVFGSYGTDFVWNAYRLKEVLLINGLPTILMYALFLFSHKDRSDYRFSNVLYINLALLLISLPFQTFIQRLGIISVLLLAVYGIMNYKSMHLKKYSQIIILSLLVSSGYPFFMHRYCYYHSNIENFFISPLPLILQNTYDIDEANDLLNDEGVLKPQFLK